MDHMIYLWPKTDEPATLDNSWYDDFWATNAYECRHTNLDIQHRNIPVTSFGKNFAVSFVNRVGGCVLRYDLVKVLSPEIYECCDFGDLTFNGVVSEKFRLVLPKHHVRIRGGKDSDCWRCTTCKQVIYNARGHWYILRNEITSHPIIGERHGDVLLISPDLAERLKSKVWRGVGQSKTPIREKPSDGFPLNIEEILPEQERRWIGIRR
jgi:hypothetical protein